MQGHVILLGIVAAETKVREELCIVHPHLEQTSAVGRKEGMEGGGEDGGRKWRWREGGREGGRERGREGEREEGREGGSEMREY